MDTTVDRYASVRALMRRATGDEKHDESSTSTLDVVLTLYESVLRIDPSAPDAEDRDRFLLSKGHGPVALYAVLATQGFFPESWLDTFLEHDGHLGGHPDRRQIPGIEVSTGSLGHGLPMAVGVALALRAKGLDEPRVFVLCGDAELNEGSNWEAVLLAPTLRLDNLTLIVVDNHSSSIAMRPWDARLSAFGWDVRLVDGHDRPSIAQACLIRPLGRPAVVVADVPEGEW